MRRSFGPAPCRVFPLDSFLMTLVFERAGKVEIEVMVEKASVLAPAHE